MKRSGTEDQDRARNRFVLAIGDTEPITISLDKRLPAGPWKARIALHSALLTRRANATLTFPERGASTPVTLARESRWPSWLYVVITALTVGLVASATTAA